MRRSLFIVLLASSMVGVGCGATGDGTVPVGAPPESAPTTVADTPTGDAPPASVPESTTTSSVESTTTSTTLPGEAFEPIYAPAGAELAVVAVRYDETLDVHLLPGTTQPVVASLAPLTTGVLSTGRGQRIPGDGSWLEVTAIGTTGWAPLSNLLYLGGTRDATSDIISLIGSTPTAPTMLDLGQMVADAIASPGPEVVSRTVVVVAPVEGATGTITYDVVDFPDDSVAGQRLAITGRQVPASNLPETAFATTTEYELVSVQSTLLCLRGVDAPSGLCI